MCTPLVAGGLAAGGTLLNALGQLQQGKAVAEASQYNIAMGEIAARDEYMKAEEMKQQLGQQFLREKATGRTQFAAGNVRLDSGSTLDWENDLSETFISDRAKIDENAARAVYGIRAQQQLDYATGAGAVRSSLIGAAGSLLAGGGKVASYWAEFPNTRVTKG